MVDPDRAPDVHPSAAKLRSFAQGLLGPEEAADLETHLSTCNACCESLEKAPPDSFVGRLREAKDLPSPDTHYYTDSFIRDPGADHTDDLADHPRYRVIRLLGRGGMGAVHLAEHKRMNRLVALKIINPELLNHPGALLRFQQEVRAAAKLDHPNIVAAYDADQAGERHFLVMEYVEGQNLADYLAEKGPLSVALACDILRQAALGLQHAHERGMVHRDIKPHNLMFTPSGLVKVLDFGLARFATESIGETVAADSITTPHLTGVGAVMGTADYIAPEQARDAHLADGRSDIYSLGCTLYHLLSGRPPFAEGTAREKLRQHSTDAPLDLRDLRPEVPEALAKVVATMMAKQPEDRYPTAEKVAAASKPLSRQLGRIRVSSLSWTTLSAAFLMVAVGCVVGFVFYRGADSQEQSAAAPPAGLVAIGRGGDHEKLQGNWMMAPQVLPNGVHVEDANIRLVILGTEFMTQGEFDKIDRTVFKLDESKDPKEIDLYLPNGPLLVHGIYALTEDELKLSLVQIRMERKGEIIELPPRSRPKSFAEKEADVIVFRRERPKALRNASPPVREKNGEIRRWRGHTIVDVGRVVVAPDGRTAWSVANDLRQWDLETGTMIRSVAPWHLGWFYLPEWTVPKGAVSSNYTPAQTAASANVLPRTNIVAMPNTLSKEELAKLPRLNISGRPNGPNLEQIAQAHWHEEFLPSPDGSQVLTTDGEVGFIRLHDAVSLKQRRVIGPGPPRYWQAAWFRDGRRVLTGGDDGVARIWDLEAGKVVVEFKSRAPQITCVDVSPDDVKLLTASFFDGTVRVLDARTGAEQFSLTEQVGDPHSARFVRNGQAVLTYGRDGSIRLFEVPTGKLNKMYRVPNRTVNWARIAVLKDGNHFASVASDGYLRLWNLETTHLLYSAPLEDTATALAVTPDGRHALIGTDSGELIQWRLPETTAAATAAASKELAR